MIKVSFAALDRNPLGEEISRSDCMLASTSCPRPAICVLSSKETPAILCLADSSESTMPIPARTTRKPPIQRCGLSRILPTLGKIDFVLRNSAQSICIRTPITIEEYAINLMAVTPPSGELIGRHRALRGSRDTGHKEENFRRIPFRHSDCTERQRKAPAGLGLFKCSLLEEDR